MTDSLFSIDLGVRDYECDLQGIVNNANYYHYFEHARHCFLRAIGLDFHQLHSAGVDPVVVRAEIDFRTPLSSGDEFQVRLAVQRRGRLRIVFAQSLIHRDGREMASATIIACVLSQGRPVEPTMFWQALERWNKEGKNAPA